MIISTWLESDGRFAGTRTDGSFEIHLGLMATSSLDGKLRSSDDSISNNNLLPGASWMLGRLGIPQVA